ncbi:MAG TPA: hypothetical protein DCG58_17285 [Hyphomonas adhaerens]|uniref:Glycosyltransferase 2-like domain-containing protein n=1 Tax=Hyphomonas adhaerens TaxID=81029 RepID=A0A3B9H382_9PROT|nr:glycosyltransferase [Hyphomonas adhaerens]HAE28916.1 hypothetical protein [Hyphomonas adhaerens]|tara:strand:- start:1571 stop:1882 length:312 start_codon:yes stop_codon:yes gene_type:complete
MFSVVIVNYNRGAFVQAALDSLRGQTRRDFEFLRVDNASTDGFADVVKPGDIGATLSRRDGLHIRSERVVDCLQGSLFEIDVSDVIVHEGDEPDFVINLPALF